MIALPNDDSPNKKPYAMAGAGSLSSSVWKTVDGNGSVTYRFNVFRLNSRSGSVTSKLRPSDLRDLVKLAYVLACILDHDGCFDQEERDSLRALITRLGPLVRSINWKRW